MKTKTKTKKKTKNQNISFKIRNYFFWNLALNFVFLWIIIRIHNTYTMRKCCIGQSRKKKQQFEWKGEGVHTKSRMKMVLLCCILLLMRINRYISFNYYVKWLHLWAVVRRNLYEKAEREKKNTLGRCNLLHLANEIFGLSHFLNVRLVHRPVFEKNECIFFFCLFIMTLHWNSRIDLKTIFQNMIMYV